MSKCHGVPWTLLPATSGPPITDWPPADPAGDPALTPAMAAFFTRSTTRARLREIDGALCVRLVAASFARDDEVPRRELLEAVLRPAGVLMRRTPLTGLARALTRDQIDAEWRQLPTDQRDASVLFFLMINSVFEAHHDVLDEIRRRIDALDEELLAPNPALNRILARVRELSRHLGAVRDGLVPLGPELREILDLRRPVERELISPAGGRWLRNLERDLASDLAGSLTIAEHRLAATLVQIQGERSETTNRIVSLLTIVTGAFFMPTLVTGLYGMNVPLPWQDRQIVFWVVIGLTAGLLTLAAFTITKLGLWGTFRHLIPAPRLFRRSDTPRR